MVLGVLAQARSGLVRVSSYLGVVNFLMLLTVLLMQVHTEAFTTINFWFFIVGSYALALSGLGLFAWFDRKFIWPNETSIGNSVNPVTTFWAVAMARLALDLEQSGEDGVRVSERITKEMDKMGHLDIFLQAKRVYGE